MAHEVSRRGFLKSVAAFAAAAHTDPVGLLGGYEPPKLPLSGEVTLSYKMIADAVDMLAKSLPPRPYYMILGGEEAREWEEYFGTRTV